MCLYVKVLASLTSESGISFLGGREGESRSDDGKLNILLGWPYPFYCCYARSSSYNFLQWQWNTRGYSFPISELLLSFLGTINFLFERLQSNSLSEAAARSYKKREFWHQIKALLWLCLEVSFFSCVGKKKHCSGFWLVVSFIHVWKKSFPPLIG